MAPPEGRGFGITLLEQAVAYRYGGGFGLDWRPQRLACTIRLPLAGIEAGTMPPEGDS